MGDIICDVRIALARCLFWEVTTVLHRLHTETFISLATGTASSRWWDLNKYIYLIGMAGGARQGKGTKLMDLQRSVHLYKRPSEEEI